MREGAAAAGIYERGAAWGGGKAAAMACPSRTPAAAQACARGRRRGMGRPARLGLGPVGRGVFFNIYSAENKKITEK